MPLNYRQQFTVFQFECDPWDRMSPGSILRRVQEISHAQCESLGINEEMYRRTHTLFLLSKISLQITRAPHLEEDIMIETRAFGMKRAVFHRVTSLHAPNGDKLCEADTRWMLIDTESRRIMRSSIPEFTPHFNDDPGTGAHQMDIPKPASPLQPVAEQTAGYLLCDRNGHINNARYADLMCDHLPLELLEKSLPKKIMLHYRAEIAMGEQFVLSRAPAADDNTFAFLASVNGARNFEGSVTF